MTTENTQNTRTEYAITEIKTNSIDDGGGVTVRIQDLNGDYDEEHHLGPDDLLEACGCF
jgi:hypothetical protein